jgi:hypothetical protein
MDIYIYSQFSTNNSKQFIKKMNLDYHLTLYAKFKMEHGSYIRVKIMKLLEENISGLGASKDFLNKTLKLLPTKNW